MIVPFSSGYDSRQALSAPFATTAAVFRRMVTFAQVIRLAPASPWHPVGGLKPVWPACYQVAAIAEAHE